MEDAFAEGNEGAAVAMAREAWLDGIDTGKSIPPPPSKPGIPELGDILVAGSSQIRDGGVTVG